MLSVLVSLGTDGTMTTRLSALSCGITVFSRECPGDEGLPGLRPAIPYTRKPCTSCDMACWKAFTAATVSGP